MDEAVTFKSVALTEDGGILIDGNISVSKSPGNRRYREVQAWIAQGNTPIAFTVVTPNYSELRRSEYPSVGDQLDVLWKQFNQMRLSGTSLIQDADDMLSAILAIKARHPKIAE